jgi:hypothetical protein
VNLLKRRSPARPGGPIWWPDLVSSIQFSPVQFSPVQFSPVQFSPVQFSIDEHAGRIHPDVDSSRLFFLFSEFDVSQI